jgi:uncharacterized protein (TIGR03437 family)
MRNHLVGIARTLLILATVLGPMAPLRAQGPLNNARFELFAQDLDRPVSITHAGDGSGRLFIVGQGGTIRVHDGQRLLPAPFLDISNRATDSGSERGLLGLAFHPDYEQNGFFYVNYTDPAGNTVIARYQVSSAANVANPASETVLLRQEQPFSNHNAGELQFGPDGYLYFGLGDGGDGGDPGNRAQNLSLLLGKMLRIDVNSGSPYAIPPTNPFASQPGTVGQGAARREIWAYGLRNPWRFSFDRQTGDMFIGDVGQNRMEEIDFQPASSRGGENYGWRRMEGTLCFNPANNCNDGSLTLPILTYPTGSNCSITGGYRYRGVQYPQWNGVYFYGDYCSGLIRAAQQAGSNWTVVDTRDTAFNISTFGEDEAGELYVADHGGGAVYRIATDHPAPQLSSLTPANAPAGSGAFTLTARGSSFVPGAQATWNGQARPTTFVDNNVLQVEISAADIAQQGAAQVVVNNPAPGGGASAALPFAIGAGMTLAPRINDGGVVNGASFAAGGALAPGSIVSIFGVDLAAGTEQAAELPLPTTLNGSTLRFNGSPNGSIAAPQFYQSPTQMNAQIPWELAGQAEATLQAEAAGATSAGIAVALTTHRPGLFSLTQTGAGQGAILISGTGLLAAAANAFPGAASRPVRRGEFVEAYATGLGPVTNRPATGGPASATNISHTATAATATIGGEAARVTFAGLAPGFVGLYQVNMEVPQNAPGGAAVAVLVRIGGVDSNAVTIAVE